MSAVNRALYVLCAGSLVAAAAALSQPLPLERAQGRGAGPPRIVEREGDVATRTCRVCHHDPYARWRDSRHANTLSEDRRVGAGAWSIALESGEDGWTVAHTARRAGADGEPETVALGERPELLALHWARPGRSFARECADCHLGGWSAAERTAQALDLACTSCHGDAAAHAAWGKADMMDRAPEDPTGAKAWERVLAGADYASWEIDEEFGSPAPRDVPNAREQVETCLRCHAQPEAWLAGRMQRAPHALDAVLPRLADERAPGSADLDAVARFATSRMHAAGVACSDCHVAHTGALYVENDRLCLRCHDAERFEAAEHHGHPEGLVPSCVACHMPTDAHGAVEHGMRPPGDPLGEWLGQTGGCTECHADRDREWIDAALAGMGGGPSRPRPEHALAREQPDAWRGLAESADQPAALRAIAAKRFAGEASPEALAPLLASEEPWVRLGALRGLAGRDLAPFAKALAPRAEDERAAVRVALGRLVAELEDEGLEALFGDAAVAVKAAVREADSAR